MRRSFSASSISLKPSSSINLASMRIAPGSNGIGDINYPQTTRDERSRPHREGRRPGLTQRSRKVGELAQQRPRVTRIDDLFDQEGLGGAERRAQLLQPLLDLGELGDRV